jgi:hypothetical protein
MPDGECASMPTVRYRLWGHRTALADGEEYREGGFERTVGLLLGSGMGGMGVWGVLTGEPELALFVPIAILVILDSLRSRVLLTTETSVLTIVRGIRVTEVPVELITRVIPQHGGSRIALKQRVGHRRSIQLPLIKHSPDLRRLTRDLEAISRTGV